MEEYIVRSLEELIKKKLFQGKAIILFGARQTGKTTLSRKLIQEEKNYQYFNCDDISVRQQLSNPTIQVLKNLVGNSNIVFIDEAQRVENIGITLKILVDEFPNVQTIATGSSSLDLSNKINEPLTGRANNFELYPLSIKELSGNFLEAKNLLEELLIYGGYPEIFKYDIHNKKDYLLQLANSSIFKDAFYEGIKIDVELVKNLLTLVAYQIGSEVSYLELSKMLEVSKDTVKKYLYLLEQARLIHVLKQYNKNSRVNVGRLKKIYFYDLGIRNALIDNFQKLQLRKDRGSLLENFFMMEMIKKDQRNSLRSNYFYWRHKTKQEIDFIKIFKDKLFAYEVKWKKEVSRPPTQFQKEYSDTEYEFVSVTSENILDYIF